MKTITRFLALGCFLALIFGLVSATDAAPAAPKTATRQISPAFLDLSVDPCSSAPMTTAQKNALLNSGYKDSILARDSYFEDVEFKTSGGVYYRKSGWVHAGTEFIYNPLDPNFGGTFVVCSNVYTYWRWQV